MQRRSHFRRLGQPTDTLFPGGAMLRAGSMVCCLLILGMIYTHARNPRTWRWLVNDDEARAAAAKENAGDVAFAASNKPTRETIVPGPTDDDPEESKAAQPLFDVLSDREPLAATDMPAYWRAMRWVRAQPFEELIKRARGDVGYQELWEQSSDYRGDLIRLRVNIRRILKFDAPENSAGVSQVYEAWGWTQDSKSFPYILVFSELPEDMTTGKEVFEEGEFVGYFLKTMLYTAYDANRAAPLLVGRMRRIDSPRPVRPKAGASSTFWMTAAGGVVLLSLAIITLRFVRSPRNRLAAGDRSATEEAAAENWLKTLDGGDSASPIDDDATR